MSVLLLLSCPNSYLLKHVILKYTFLCTGKSLTPTWPKKIQVRHGKRVSKVSAKTIWPKKVHKLQQKLNEKTQNCNITHFRNKTAYNLTQILPNLGTNLHKHSLHACTFSISDTGVLYIYVSQQEGCWFLARL